MEETSVRTALQGDFTVETVIGHVEEAGIVSEPATEAEPVPEEHFLNAMRRLASGVALVTTRVDGRPWGLTISSFCSLTLTPPQVIISLGSETVSCKQILEQENFGVSVLGENQEELARVGAASGVAKFVDDYCADSVDRSEGTCETPAAKGALCHLDCTVVRTMTIASHTVIVGLVTGTVFSEPEPKREPLVYVDRMFCRPEPLPREGA